MVTDAEIKEQGIEVLIDKLGEIQAERFIALIRRESFDYTKWQKKLWMDKTIEEISSSAMKLRKIEQEKSSN